MRILQMAPLWKPVPPKKYGGTELVVSNLSEALVKMGHEVTLFACGGSHTTGNLHEIIPDPLYETLGRFSFDSVQFADFLSIHAAIKLAHSQAIDVIHNHMGFHVALISEALPVPMITTLHSSLPPDNIAVAQAAAQASYVSISNAQRSLAPYLNYRETIYHGINVASFPFREQPGSYLLFLATLWNEKGVDRAVEIARRAGIPLILAGDTRRQEDFEAIRPYIDGTNVIYRGEVDFQQKTELMANALAYLFPVRWSEAFGLTVVESLACGTPVVAYPNGSLPEIIEHGLTGFLVNDIDEAVAAVSKIRDISRDTCRKTAEQRFDSSVMANNYLNLYQKQI